MAVITNITIGGVRYEVADATSGFVTRMVDDLQNYYRKSEVDERLSAIPKFAITVVDSLPTENISPTTVYLMKTGDEDRNLFSEFIYAGEKWEMLGTQSVDLTPYAKREDVDAELAQKATVERVNALEVEVAKKASQADLDKANQAIDQQDKGLATKAETAEVETLKATVETKADKANTLTGYGITDAYTKSEVDTEVAKKADKSDTLAGYGITDAVTKSELQQVLQTEGVQADWAQSDETQKSFIQNKPDLTQFVNAETAGSIADSKVKSNLSLYVKQTDLNQALQTKADKATTLEGYGITDAYTKVQTSTFFPTRKEFDKVDTKVTELATTVSGKADKSVTLAGYKIGDAYTKAQVDEALALIKQNSQSAHDELKEGKADKATTLAGYGITDAYTQNSIDTALATNLQQAHSYTNEAIAHKADSSNSLSGYGIQDAYTKTEVDSKVDVKANKATTLGGYGITDAYTKTEVDGKLKTPAGEDKYLPRYGDRGVLGGYSTAAYAHIVENPRSSYEARDLVIFEIECEEWFIDVERNSFVLVILDETNHIDIDWSKPKCKTIVFTFNFRVDSSISWQPSPGLLYWVGGEAPAIGKAGSKAIVVLRTLGDFAVGSLYWSSEGN